MTAKLGARITRLDPTLGAVVAFWLESGSSRLRKNPVRSGRMNGT